MEADKIFNVFDSLVTPVALYGCEFWLPLVLPKKCFSSCQNLLSFWKDFLCEKTNQKCARITLSVNRKTRRLAVLGKLGRYPLLIKALSHCLNYKMSLLRPNSQQSSLLHDENTNVFVQEKRQRNQRHTVGRQSRELKVFLQKSKKIKFNYSDLS